MYQHNFQPLQQCFLYIKMHVRNVWTGDNLHQIEENHYKKK